MDRSSTHTTTTTCCAFNVALKFSRKLSGVLSVRRDARKRSVFQMWWETWERVWATCAPSRVQYYSCCNQTGCNVRTIRRGHLKKLLHFLIQWKAVTVTDLINNFCGHLESTCAIYTHFSATVSHPSRGYLTNIRVWFVSADAAKAKANLENWKSAIWINLFHK